MNILSSKKGYTLVELLAVIAIIVIVASFTFSIFAELNKVSNNRVDQSRVVIYNKAFEDFRFADYSTLQSSGKDKVAVAEGGKVKINQYLNLSGQDIEALSNSGKGKYPQTHRECVAAIRAYCGTNDILPLPAAGYSFAYFYHIPEGKCYVKRVDEISASDTDWINLSEYYTLVTNYILGDVDGDKQLTSLDVKKIEDVANGLSNITDIYLYKCCDVNKDGNVTSVDAAVLRKYVDNSGTPKPEWE